MRRHHGRSPFASKVAPPLSDAATLLRTFETETNPARPMRPSPLAASQIQDMPLDVIDRIRSFPLFQSTPESFLAAIGVYLRPQMHQANDYILTEGDDAKAMYWLVRGAVAVTSRDGESTYAELKAGAFFGEIGILMERPRTATIVARTRCLLVSLKKEDLQKILPSYPDVERAIREEAQERLMILERKKKESQPIVTEPTSIPSGKGSKRLRDKLSEDSGRGVIQELDVNGRKKRKSPSPMADVSTSSALGNGLVNVRMLLKQLPLFSELPPEILHFLGLNAQPRSYPPFKDIIKQGSMGQEVYFLVHGEVEVIDEYYDFSNSSGCSNGLSSKPANVKARLKEGQYFGEVVSLSLAPRRTATVRSVTAVECLMISGEVLSEFWERCPPTVKRQVEETARTRLQSASDNDVIMQDQGETTPAIDELAIGEKASATPRRQGTPKVTFNDFELSAPQRPARNDDSAILDVSDPDPFLSVGLEKVKQRSRRGSLAPPPPDERPSEMRKKSASPPGTRPTTPAPGRLKRLLSSSSAVPKRTRLSPTRESAIISATALPDRVLHSLFQFFDIHDLMKFRLVSKRWMGLLTTSPHILRHLDLTPYNRKLTDEVLTKIICPFVGPRPRFVNISNCFHVTDEGFSALAATCGMNVTTWRMKSVWDVTALTILDMANRAKNLEEINLSNCRKVSDTLLARIVGWVVPSLPPQTQNTRPLLNPHAARAQQQQESSNAQQPPPGTVIGCPKLKNISLSYCKHITDRSMHHIAVHAANRIEQIDLTRCTTITDTGFQYWGNTQFTKLRKLCLADCTYLTDNAIVYLTNAAKELQELDLSFCCALSDTSTEVLSLGCPTLTHLSLSFCGSAVSDASLRLVGLHLTSLRELAVRGCVRVTGGGVESVVEGCRNLQVFDVSQCKNLTPWLQTGAAERGKYKDVLRWETFRETSGRLSL